MPAADLYSALWRHRVMIVLLTLLAGVVAFAYTRTQPKIYEAGALVRIQQRESGDPYGLGSLELGQRLAQTYARIVTTHSIKERVVEKLDGKVTTGDVSITANPVGDVELLSILARSEDPRTAAAVANAATAALRDFIRETGTLRDQIVVVDEAGVPSFPVLPRTTITVVLAVLLAFIFNAAIALAREFFADRLPDTDDWETRFGRPVLATIPVLNMRPYSAVARAVAAVEPPADDEAVAALQAVGGPTRWSVDLPEVHRRVT